MDLSSIIKTQIEMNQSQQKRNYIGCSSIGSSCDRAIWYGYKGYPQSNNTAISLVAFDIGKRLESMVMSYLSSAGLVVIGPSEFNHQLLCSDDEVPSFKGHMDGVIMNGDEPCALEIKTAKNSRFQVFKNKGLKQWSEAYYAQLMSYMGMRGYKKGVLIALNKDSSEFHHEWIDYDEYYYNGLRHKAKIIQDADEPPERINKSPLFVTCSRCSYKDICFKEQTNHEETL